MLLVETDFDIGRVYGFVYLIIEIPCCFYLISIQGLFRDLCYIGRVNGFIYLFLEIPCCFYLISILGLFRDRSHVTLGENMVLKRGQNDKNLANVIFEQSLWLCGILFVTVYLQDMFRYSHHGHSLKLHNCTILKL